MKSLHNCRLLTAVRNRFFAGAPLTVSIEHCVVRDHQVLGRQTILAGGEEAGKEFPAYAPFHANAEGKLFVLASVATKSSGGKAAFDNRLNRIMPEMRQGDNTKLNMRFPFANLKRLPIRASPAPQT